MKSLRKLIQVGGNIVLFGIGMLALSSQCLGQTPSKKPKVYKVSITLMDLKVKRGFLVEVGDSSVLVVNGSIETRIASSSIDRIRIYSKGHIGRGALIGGAIGVLTGVSAGLMSGDDECDGCWFTMTAEEKASMGAIFLGLGGSMVGLLLGSQTKAAKLSLHGDQDLFFGNKSLLQQYVFKPSPEKQAQSTK